MADEIRLTVQMSIVNGTFKESINPGLLMIDQAAVGQAGGVISVGTSEEAIGVGDISSLGYCYLQNLDTAHFVEYGPDSSGMVSLGKLLPGEIAVFRLKPGVSLKMKADTAACLVDVRIFEA